MRKRTRLPGFNSKLNTLSGSSVVALYLPVARFSFHNTKQDLTLLDLFGYLILIPVSPINRAFALV